MDQIIIKGKVVKGAGYGRVLGFPTANIERRSYGQLKIKPKLGVWGGYVEIPNSKFQITKPVVSLSNHKSKIPNKKIKNKFSAAIVIGPIDKTGLPKIEAYLIGFKGNLYNIYLNIYLNKYIRPFRKFKGQQELINQIKKDIQWIKRNIHRS